VAGLRLDPEAEVMGGSEAERVAMAGKVHGILGLGDVDWEGGIPTGEFDVNGTTAATNAWSYKRRMRKPSGKRTWVGISCPCIPWHQVRASDFKLEE
jgi:hypothetical protein